MALGSFFALGWFHAQAFRLYRLSNLYSIAKGESENTLHTIFPLPFWAYPVTHKIRENRIRMQWLMNIYGIMFQIAWLIFAWVLVLSFNQWKIVEQNPLINTLQLEFFLIIFATTISIYALKAIGSL